MHLLFILTIFISQSTLIITSSSFTDGGIIPALYTCDGTNISPELSVTEVPDGSKTLVLIMYDADVASLNVDHWVSFDIIPGGRIKDDAEPGVKGTNSNGSLGYFGPCPTSGTHEYHFKVYALDTQLNLREGATRKMVEGGMTGHILATGEFTGFYKRK